MIELFLDVLNELDTQDVDNAIPDLSVISDFNVMAAS
jgi:hypothetical protein